MQEVEASAEPDPELVRRIQRTGMSSLSVTLPKAWTEALGIQNGDRVMFRDLGSGRLELALLSTNRATPSPESRTLQLDARSAPRELLGRLVIGGFITGQERIVVTGALSPEARGEIGEAVERLLGTSVVDEAPERLELQNFVDPARYPLPKLLSRIGGLLRAQVEMALKALEGGDPPDLARIGSIEDDVDRVYLVLVRQLLIASDDFRVATLVGVPSHHYQLGYRLVAKTLEVIGDLLFDVAVDLAELGHRSSRVPGPVREHLLQSLREFAVALERTLGAFSQVSVVEANEGLNEAHVQVPRFQTEGPQLSARVKDRTAAVLVGRVATTLAQARKMLGVVDEVTLNKGVEPETLSRSGPGPLRVSPRPHA